MQDKINIRVQHSILISKSCEDVWDFTQDFSTRTQWDGAMIECKLIADSPERKAFIKVKGGLTAMLEYKLFDRPHKTSLHLTEINSPLLIDGGGSWTYEKQTDGKTLWTQTNVIALKNSFVSKLLKKFIARDLKSNTIKSMQKAKQIIETTK